MYEYDYRQNGGFIYTPPVTYGEAKRVIKSVTVIETFDENEKLVARKTVTEYEDGKPSTPITWNNGVQPL